MATKLTFILIGLTCYNFCNCYPRYKESSDSDDGSGDDGQMSMNDALKYLKKYDYIEEDENGNMTTMMAMNSQQLRSSRKMKQAIVDFQCTWGAKRTGIIDDDTAKLMKRRRCGVPDSNTRCKNGVKNSHNRQKRYTQYGLKWPRNEVSYRINSYTNDLSVSEINTDFAKAMKVWSDASQLRVTELDSGKPNILVDFFERNHGDNDPFDGPGGVLAHAYFPGGNDLDGDVHFDDSETFTRNQNSGINFLWVAAHEAGHALGLGHSNDNDALMAPFYTGYDPNFKLHSDDIAGIQSLYGSPIEERPTTSTTSTTSIPTTESTTSSTTTTTPTTSTTSTTTKSPYETTTEYEGCEICSDSSIDAVALARDGSTLIFKGKYYYTLHDGAYTQNLIAHDWPNAPDYIDAALYIAKHDYTLMFKNNAVYVYSSRNYLGYMTLNRWIYGLPSKIDSIFYYKSYKYVNYRWVLYKYIFVTVGDQYYKINAYNYKMYPNYPKDLSVWWDKSQSIPNLPEKIDGAYLDKSNRLFFLSDGRYFYYNTRYDSIQGMGNLRTVFHCSSSQRSNIVESNTQGRLTRSIDMESKSPLKLMDMSEDTFIMVPEKEEDNDDMIMIDMGGLIPMESGDLPLDIENMVNSDDDSKAMKQRIANDRGSNDDGNSSSMIKSTHSCAVILSLVLCFILK